MEDLGDFIKIILSFSRSILSVWF